MHRGGDPELPVTATVEKAREPQAQPPQPGYVHPTQDPLRFNAQHGSPSAVRNGQLTDQLVAATRPDLHNGQAPSTTNGFTELTQQLG